MSRTDRLRGWWVVQLAVVLCTLGCGPKGSNETSGTDGDTDGSDSETSASTDDSSGSTSSGDASSGGVTTDDPTACPESPPEDGSPCPLPAEAYQCSWGDSPIPHCHTVGTCLSSGWSMFFPDCDPAPPGCPATPPAAGTQCEDDGLQCGFEDGTVCGCTACPGPCTPDPPQWYCSGPPEPGCPPTPPNMGDPCPGDEPLHCDYGTCAAGTPITANCIPGGSNKWQWNDQPCPL